MDIVSGVVFLIVVGLKWGALIGETIWGRIETANSGKPEVAPREGAMGARISGPWTFLNVGIVF